MSKKAFPRTYKNNLMYAEDKLPYIDALALTVQKHLYTKKNAVYYLAGTIELWDFMSLTRCYIIASRSEFGQSDIETYNSNMNDPYAQVLGGDAVKYTKNLDHIILNGTPANVLSLMWAAWIYAKVLHEVCKYDEKPLWQRAAEQLYNSMEVFYDESGHKCFGESNRLLSIADDAVNTMKGYIAEKYPTAKNTQVQKPSPAIEQSVLADDDTAKLELRIAELEADNASLRKQLEEERQKNQGIDDLPELDEVQKMTLHQKIVFFTTVTSVLLDKRYTNMRNLASFIASMCNEKPSTIAPMLSRIGQISDDNPNPKLSATLHSAAQCVSDLLLQILTDETRHDKSQIINKIREDLLLNYPLPEDE